MTLYLIGLPVLAVAAAVALGVVRWPVRPTQAVGALTALTGGAAVIAVSLVTLPAVGFAASFAPVAALLERCAIGSPGHRVPWPLGWATLLASVWVLRRARAAWRAHRSAWRSVGTDGVQVLATSEPIAYARPGRPGSIVVSTGMLEALPDDERAVLIAHEQSHLRRAHHVHLLVCDLALAVVPALRPLTNQLRLALERCADEDAVVRVGGDRGLVARALARATVATSEHPPAVAGIAGTTVPDRVAALVADPAPRPVSAVALALLGVALVAQFVTLVEQGRHLWLVATHLCG